MHKRAFAALVGASVTVVALAPAPGALGATDATTETGAVWAWGWNSNGELGDGTQQNERSVPAPVAGLEEVSAVSAGFLHSLVLETDGTVWAAGYGSCGQQATGRSSTARPSTRCPASTTSPPSTPATARASLCSPTERSGRGGPTGTASWV